MSSRSILIALCAAVAIVGCGDGDEDSDARTFEGSPEEQVVATLAAYSDAVAEGDGETACSYLTEPAQRILVKASEGGGAGTRTYDPAACPGAVDELLSPLSIGETDVTPEQVTIEPDGRAVIDDDDSANALGLVPDDGGWLLEVPFFTGG